VESLLCTLLVVLEGGSALWEKEICNSNFWISCILFKRDDTEHEVRLQVKISMKFLNGWPVVGRVRLCFASTPQLTMSYKPYNKNFLDVSLIPGVQTSVVSF